ncbi:MAG: tetratricopeptide repeat protein, partial [Spirochaeta sp.]|nr:tetratricopeptide repeat protein [Spirochaeta sp.]
MNTRVRSAIRWTGRIALFLLLMAGAVRFNGNILDARLGHLDMLLERGSQSETHSATELIGRYRLILRRLEEGEDSLAAFQTEAQLAVLETEPLVVPTGDADDESLQRERRDTVERAVISVLRRLSGKPVIEVAHRDAIIERIKDAYLSERRRDWATAINSYEAILAEEVLNAREIAVVYLHLGFCYSMDGEFDRALSTYNRVLAGHPGTQEARSAAILIESLRALVDARNAIAESVLPPDTGDGTATRDSPDDGPGGQEDMQRLLSTGRTAFLRLEYDKAITALDALLQRSVPPGTEAEARYYRARSLEERGDFTEATSEYHAVQSLPAAEATPWDDRARRRTAMIRAFYTDAEVPDEADDAFLAVVERYGDIRRDQAVPEASDAPTLAAAGELLPGETVSEENGTGVDRSPDVGSADAGSEEGPSRVAGFASRAASQPRETAASRTASRAATQPQEAAATAATRAATSRFDESNANNETEASRITQETGGHDESEATDQTGDDAARRDRSSGRPGGIASTGPDMSENDELEEPIGDAMTATTPRGDGAARLPGRVAAMLSHETIGYYSERPGSVTS